MHKLWWLFFCYLFTFRFTYAYIDIQRIYAGTHSIKSESFIFLHILLKQNIIISESHPHSVISIQPHRRTIFSFVDISVFLRHNQREDILHATHTPGWEERHKNDTPRNRLTLCRAFNSIHDTLVSTFVPEYAMAHANRFGCQIGILCNRRGHYSFPSYHDHAHDARTCKPLLPALPSCMTRDPATRKSGNHVAIRIQGPERRWRGGAEAAFVPGMSVYVTQSVNIHQRPNPPLSAKIPGICPLDRMPGPRLANATRILSFELNRKTPGIHDL